MKVVSFDLVIEFPLSLYVINERYSSRNIVRFRNYFIRTCPITRVTNFKKDKTKYALRKRITFLSMDFALSSSLEYSHLRFGIALPVHSDRCGHVWFIQRGSFNNEARSYNAYVMSCRANVWFMWSIVLIFSIVARTPYYIHTVSHGDT